MKFKPVIASKSAHEIRWDNETVWIHDATGGCTARFGKAGFEIRIPERDPLIRIGNGPEVWQEFVHLANEIMSIRLPPNATPLRLRNAFDIQTDDANDISTVSIAEIVSFYNPLDFEALWAQPLADVLADIRKCIDTNTLAKDYVEPEHRMPLGSHWDLARIAWFVKNPDPTPIEIEVIATDGTWELVDGFHRLSAAIYRNDQTIKVALGGYVDAYDIAFPSRTAVESANQTHHFIPSERLAP